MKVNLSGICFGVFVLSIAVSGCTEGRGAKPDHPVQTVTAEKPPAPPAPPANAEPYQVKFETSKGDFVLEVQPKWAPYGAQRFKELIEIGYYKECRFFRVVPKFMVQLGINGDPAVQARWKNAEFPDDKVVESNKRGMVSFATKGKNTRTTQFFINFADNSRLDGMGFSPFAKVISGMEVVDNINSQYRELPDQMRIQSEGNAYLKEEFPELDYIKNATIVKPAEGAPKVEEKK